MRNSAQETKSDSVVNFIFSLLFLFFLLSAVGPLNWTPHYWPHDLFNRGQSAQCFCWLKPSHGMLCYHLVAFWSRYVTPFCHWSLLNGQLPPWASFTRGCLSFWSGGLQLFLYLRRYWFRLVVLLPSLSWARRPPVFPWLFRISSVPTA